VIKYLQTCHISLSFSLSFSIYSVFHRFRQAKFGYGGSILSQSQFLLILQRPLKTTLVMKVVKIDRKIIVVLPWSKFGETGCFSDLQNQFVVDKFVIKARSLDERFSFIYYIYITALYATFKLILTKNWFYILSSSITPLLLFVSFLYISQYIQWNSVITNSVVNEHSVITNRFLSQIGYLSTQINTVTTNPGYNRVWLYYEISLKWIFLV